MGINASKLHSPSADLLKNRAHENTIEKSFRCKACFNEFTNEHLYRDHVASFQNVPSKIYDNTFDWNKDIEEHIDIFETDFLDVDYDSYEIVDAEKVPNILWLPQDPNVNREHIQCILQAQDEKNQQPSSIEKMCEAVNTSLMLLNKSLSDITNSLNQFK